MIDAQRTRRKDIRKEEVKRELLYTVTLEIVSFGLYLTSFLERSYVVYAATCILSLETNEALGRSYVHCCHVGKVVEVPVDSNKEDNRIWLGYKELGT